MDTLTIDQMRELLRSTSIIEGSQAALAVKLGIGQKFLSEVLHGTRGISQTIAEGMGYTRQTIFVKKEAE